MASKSYRQQYLEQQASGGQKTSRQMNWGARGAPPVRSSEGAVFEPFTGRELGGETDASIKYYDQLFNRQVPPLSVQNPYRGPATTINPNQPAQATSRTVSAEGGMTWDDFKRVATEVARQEGFPPSVLLGQAALETGRDVSSAPGFNFFGIKGQGSAGSQTLATKEATKEGNLYSTKSNFAKYQSPEDSVRAYIDLIKTRFPRAWALKDDPQAMVRAIQAGGYATDPQYASKVMSTPEFREAEASPVQKFMDLLTPTAYASDRGATPLSSSTSVPTTPEYIVKKGDTLWDIAQKTLGSGYRWKELMGYSGEPTKLPIGTKLTIPTPNSQSARISPNQTPSARISPDQTPSARISPNQTPSARITPDQTPSARISPNQPTKTPMPTQGYFAKAAPKKPIGPGLNQSIFETLGYK